MLQHLGIFLVLPMLLHLVLFLILDLLPDIFPTVKLALYLNVFGSISSTLTALHQCLRTLIMLSKFVSLGHFFCIQIIQLLFLYLDRSVSWSFSLYAS